MKKLRGGGVCREKETMYFATDTDDCIELFIDTARILAFGFCL